MSKRTSSGSFGNHLIVVTVLFLAVSGGWGVDPFTPWASEDLTEDDAIDEGLPEQAPGTATIAPTLRFTRGHCPAPFLFAGLDVTNQNTQCILPRNATIDATLFVHNSDITLDCMHHMILPRLPATGSAASQASSPLQALVIAEAHGVTVQNCKFGQDNARFSGTGDAPVVLVVNAKTPPPLKGNKILNNEVHAWITGMAAFKSDQVEMDGNLVTYVSRMFNGIVVGVDADDNRVTHNTVISKGLVDVEGTNDRAIGIFSVGGLTNYVYGGTLVQMSLATGGTISHSDNNLIEGNLLVHECPGETDPLKTCAGAEGTTGVVVAQGGDSNRVVGNTASGGAGGVELAGIFTLDFVIPGTCSLDSSRLCQTDAHCFLVDFDSTSKGTCLGAFPVTISAIGSNSLVEDNTLPGPYTSRAIPVGSNQDAPIIRGNRIGRPGVTQNFIGIRIGGTALETAIVERNTVTGTTRGVELFRGNPPTQIAFFGAQFTLNDIFGNTLNIGRSATNYTVPSELSVNGEGNYWGHTCAEGGFLASASDTLLITDSHPYGGPVASTPDANLPAACK
jgi:hypothetical protein